MTTMNTAAASLSDAHFTAIRIAQCASCTCLTKTPEVKFHAADCRYRLLEEVLRALSTPTPQADAAPIISGHEINDLFLKWSEWTTELGEAISRKNIDGFVSELRAAIAAGGAQEAVATLHDDGHYTWHGDKPHDFNYAGWRMDVYAAPLANEASKPAAQQTLSDGAQFFACYLIDNCENEVVREESVQAWLGKMLTSPRYHPAAPSVEQDERGASNADIAAAATQHCYARTAARGWIFGHVSELRAFIRAASTSANGDRFDPYRLKVAEECCERLMSACTDAGCPDGVRMDDWIRENIRSTSANVAQGAEAVATVKVYETYTGQNGWIEVTQEEYDRTKDKYEHRIRRVSAPPAQTAITGDARDSIIEAMARAMNMATDGHERYWSGYVKSAEAAFDAAQSASGDTNG